MNPEYPDRQTQKGTYFDVIFALIVLLASGFSAFTTYLGFSKDLPLYMSIPIAVTSDWASWESTSRSGRHESTMVPSPVPFLVFFIVLVFSFISNTNAFYSRPSGRRHRTRDPG